MHKTTQYHIQTSHGRIAVEIKGEGYPVVFIHGNSACRQVFRNQMASPLFEEYRLITFDLPGHGDSENARDPERTYTRPGLAKMTVELLGELGVDNAVIVGASLGGHVAIEMLAHSAIPIGLFLMGTPAVGTNMSEGFVGKPLNGFASQDELSSTQTEQFAELVFGAKRERFMELAIERTDRKFRSALFAAAGRGAGINQKKALTNTNALIAIINGSDDRIINLDYIDSVAYSNLWQGKCFRIPNATHSPFWDQPDIVNDLLSSFLSELCH